MKPVVVEKPPTAPTRNLDLADVTYGYDDVPVRDNDLSVDGGKNPFASKLGKENTVGGGGTSGLTYGQRKRRMEDDYMVVDKCHDLEKENLVLKEKENLLEREILKMQTKLRRIEELLKSKRTFSDGDFGILQRELEEQFGEIMDENTVLQDRIKKLQIIHKHLTTKGTTTVDLTHKASKKTYQVVGASTHLRGGSKSRTVVTNRIPGEKVHQPKHLELVEELKI